MNNSKKIELIIYYTNKKANQLIMKNNLNPPTTSLDSTGVIYEFLCPVQGFKPASYIGMAQVTKEKIRPTFL